MNDLSLIVNISVRVITTVIFIGVLLPLFIKEAKVKNGLKVLRYELLLTGLIISIINIAGVLMMLSKFWNEDLRMAQDIITYFNTFGFLIYAILIYKIYTRRYTPEQKKLHEKFYKIEEEALKKTKHK